MKTAKNAKPVNMKPSKRSLMYNQKRFENRDKAATATAIVENNSPATITERQSPSETALKKSSTHASLMDLVPPPPPPENNNSPSMTNDSTNTSTVSPVVTEVRYPRIKNTTDTKMCGIFIGHNFGPEDLVVQPHVTRQALEKQHGVLFTPSSIAQALLSYDNPLINKTLCQNGENPNPFQDVIDWLWYNRLAIGLESSK